MEERYTAEWFKARAMAGITPIEQGSWDYSDSLLLYLPGFDQEYEAVQETDTLYHTLVTAPERKYLETIAPSVVQELPAQFEYIDLGPGTEHKEQFVFDAAKAQGKSFIYRPVDISERYLQLSTEYAEKQGIPVQALKSSFEELPSALGPEEGSRFLSIGLTYGNYNPSEILTLLKSLIGKNGSAFINVQIKERVDTESIRAVYAEVAGPMVAGKIGLLDLDPETDIAEVEVTDEVKVWYRLRNVSPALAAKGVHPGDRLLVLQSLRPSLEQLTKDVSAVFPSHHVFDTDESFVGMLLD